MGCWGGLDGRVSAVEVLCAEWVMGGGLFEVWGNRCGIILGDMGESTGEFCVAWEGN